MLHSGLKPFYVTVWSSTDYNNRTDVLPNFSKYKAYPVLSILQFPNLPISLLIPDDFHELSILPITQCTVYDTGLMMTKPGTTK